MTSYVGFDVSLAETSVCVLDAGGGVRFESKVKGRPDDLIACVREHAPDAERVGLETGQTSALLFRAVEAAELPVVRIETRHAHKVLSARSNKTDRNDARGLAELVRVGWYREDWVRGAPAHAIRSLLLGRRMLLATRRTLENTSRGAVKRFGLIITKTAGLATDRTHRAEEGAGCGCADAGRHHARHLVGRHRVRVEGCRLAPFRSPSSPGEASLPGREPASTS